MPWGLLILLAIGLALAWAFVVGYTAWMFTHPPRRSYAWAVSRNVPGDPSEVPPPTRWHGSDRALPIRPVETPATVAAATSERGLAFCEWTFRSRGLELPVWDVTGLNPDGPTIIITHGWADSRVVMLSRLAFFASIASRVILWDLPGHGSAPGTCAVGTREAEDLLVLVSALAPPPGERVTAETSNQRNGVVKSAIRNPQSEITLYGFSLGAGLAIAAAAQSQIPIAAIIAESPYRIPPTPGRNVLCLRALPYRATFPAVMAILGLRFGHGLEWAQAAIRKTRDGAPKFDRALAAAKLPAATPLLVLHGAADPVCPIEDGREIAAAAPNAEFVAIEGGGHNNLWTDPALTPRVYDAVTSFLSSRIGAPTSTIPSTPHS